MEKNKIELVGAVEPEMDHGRVYLVKDGKRHWIPSPQVAGSYGWDLAKTRKIPYQKLLKYTRSYDIAFNYEKADYPSVASQGVLIHPVWGRQWFGAQFTGHGLEIAAASSPWPCKPGVTVDYTDPYGEDEGCKVEYEDKDYVPLTYRASLEDMSDIRKTDYDFICCSHVIEHTPNVLLALKNIYEHLSSRQGVFVMAVPHRDYTFDRLRELTTLEHIISDYEDYCCERDMLHIVDYIENAHVKCSGGGQQQITKLCRAYLEGKGMDIHYHTFTEENMSAILTWFHEKIHPWSSMEIFQRLEGANEFFVRLVR